MNAAFKLCEAGMANLLLEKHRCSLAEIPVRADLAHDLAHLVGRVQSVGPRPPASTRRMTRRANRAIRRLRRPPSARPPYADPSSSVARDGSVHTCATEQEPSPGIHR